MQQLRYTGAKPQRLDAFLRAQYPCLALHKHLRRGNIKVNGKKAPLSARLSAGDIVALYIPEAELAHTPPVPLAYEDTHILVADKPAGLATLAPEGQDSLHARLLATKGEGGGFPAPCHRVDTGTSGLVLFAKTPAALALCEQLLRHRSLEKIYLCVTLGHPSPPAGTLAGWHTKNPRAGTVRVTSEKRPGARPVETLYETLAISGGLALVKARLVTGRTHQIRASFAAAGTPLLGDSKYGSLAANRARRCRYQCLCAASLRFPTGLPAGFESLEDLEITATAPWFAAQIKDGTLR